MKRLSPEFFFDLVDFKHQALFLETEYVFEALKKIEIYLKEKSLGKIEGVVEMGATLINPELISIGQGYVVEDGSYIVGPCLIGEACEIRHGAYLRGGVITGDRCVIGHATEVKNSIFLNGAKASHFAYVGDSILGKECNLGAGTKLANLRLDKKEIFISFEGEKIATGLRKLGAIIGDYAQTGCNSVTNPGTFMGKGKICFPCENISGFF
jgi:NDP-sugar pyrophosphorylase family protein